MNRRPDVELVLRDYLADDSLTAPDYILDVVEGRISRQPQRRSWRLSWRHPMSTPFKLAAGIAAVVLVALVGWQLMPGRGDGIGGPQSPTATLQPSATPVATASAAAVVDLPEGLLPGGRYRFQPLAEVPSLSVAADVPSGWHGEPPWAVVGPNTEEPPGGILLGFFGADGLFSDPCHWDLDGTGDPQQPGDIEVGPEVIDLVEALRAHPSYGVSDPPSQVSFGEFQGYEIDIQLPSDIDPATCDTTDGRGRYFVFSGDAPYAQGNGTDRDRWHLFIVDVNGTRVVVAILYYEGTPIADREAARSIIESIEFAP